MTIQKMLLRDEGRVPSAYQDSLGYWTIGVGHLIDRRKGGGLPSHIIDLLLDYDIQSKEAELVAALPWVKDLSEPRRAVLICMAFQLGVPGLLKFKNSLATLRAGDYTRAAAMFLNSKVAKTQTPARWKRYANQLKTGEWV